MMSELMKNSPVLGTIQVKLPPAEILNVTASTMDTAPWMFTLALGSPPVQRTSMPSERLTVVLASALVLPEGATERK